MYSVLECHKTERGAIIHKVMEENGKTEIKYAAVVGGIHFPMKNSPGFHVFLGELYNFPERDEENRIIRGPIHLLSEAEYHSALTVMFSQLTDTAQRLLCADVYCDDESPETRDYSNAFRDFRYREKIKAADLRRAPFSNNFSLGLHEIRHQMDIGRLKISEESICYSQMAAIQFEDLKDPDVSLRFPGINALRYALTGIADRTPKCYQKRPTFRNKNRRGMAV